LRLNRPHPGDEAVLLAEGTTFMASKAVRAAGVAA
jgi:hypothetical protein